MSVVVFDNGSGTVKAGFAGECAPRSIIPTMVGRPKYKRAMHSPSYKPDSYIGEMLMSRRGILTMSHPLQRGIITDWEEMESIWNHTLYHHLKVEPSHHPFLMIESVANPKYNREKMMEFLFEEFRVPSMYMGLQSVFSLFANGKTTGVCVESGEGVTRAVPVYEGYSIPHAITNVKVAGCDITEMFCNSMRDRGYPFRSTGDLELMKAIKERCCFVADKIERETKRAETFYNSFMELQEEQTYQLPDGTEMKIRREDRFKCTEALFSPWLMGHHKCPGIHVATCDSIVKCDMDIRKVLYGNVVLSGGSTTMPGMVERLEREIKDLAPCDVRFKLSAPIERLISPWLGAVALASLSTFEEMSIDRKEYEECGLQIIHRKCF